ncbi:Alpha/Beta hydrolase protein [Trichoderma velutinum]
MFISAKRFLLFTTCITEIAVATCDPDPVVDLGYVKYRGVYNNATDQNEWHGIHYAQPPVGHLRWNQPRPIEEKNSFNGQILSAAEYGFNCPQMAPPTIPAAVAGVLNNTSEDCLLLDIYVPAKPVSTSLPVMVNLHGGGYTIGGASAYQGGGIVYQSHGNMIYVVAQYRLGMFGFLAGSEVLANGVANAGLLDQRAALMWVQRNIRAFGGDPSRVTLYGASAGGGSVIYQLIGNGGSETVPFSAAIAELPWVQPLMNLSSQNIQYQNILSLANCTSLTCLRSLDSETLKTLNQEQGDKFFPNPGYGQGTFGYGPVVDGQFVRELPSQAFRQGNFAKVPLLTDHDAYEGVMFSDPNVTTQVAETQDARFLFPNAGTSFFGRLFQLYPRSNFNSTFFQRQTWFGDVVVNCPTYYAASAYTDHGLNQSAVFKLVFDAGSQLHGATVAFIMSEGTDWDGANNKTLARIMSDYYISFVVAHDPNVLRTAGAPFWKSYIDTSAASVNGTASFNVLSVTYNSISNEQDPDASAQCDFFYSRDTIVSN